MSIGLRELGAALFRAGDAGLRLPGGWRVHRALPWTALALALSAAAALVVRAATPAPDPTLEWYSFGFRDERWLVLFYWLAVASCLFVPLLASGRLPWTRAATGAGPPASATDAPAARVAVRVALAVGAYTLWLGPPWNLALLERPMEWHEIVHLGPLQALLVGKLPYVESGTQYGPGLQLLALHYLEHFGVSLLRFRELWLWTHFVGGLVIVAWMAALFRPLALVAGLVVLRTLSPFVFFEAAAGGSYDFFFGWANCIRYAGAVHAALAVAAILGRPGDGLGPGERSFLVGSGALWGLFVLISQENLGCGVAGVGIVAAFALLTRSVPIPRIATALLAFGAGAALGLAPLVSLYAAAGELGAFLQRYFAIGGLIVQGYSNTPFEGAWHSTAGILYRSVPVVACLAFAVAAFDGGLARRRRFHLIGAAAGVLACFAPALLRTATPHILAACTPLAVLTAAMATHIGHGRAPAARLALIAALLPIALAFKPADIARLLADPAGRVRAFAAAADREAAPAPGRVGFAYDADAPYSVFSEMSLAEFLDVGRRIRDRVGARPVVISSAIGTRGHWYFFADLTPLGSDPEPSMTIVNSRLRARYLAELEVGGIPCVVSTRPVDTELAIFRAQPGERDEWWIETSERPFYVGCMRDTAGPIARHHAP